MYALIIIDCLVEIVCYRRRKLFFNFDNYFRVGIVSIHGFDIVVITNPIQDIAERY